MILASQEKMYAAIALPGRLAISTFAHNFAILIPSGHILVLNCLMIADAMTLDQKFRHLPASTLLNHKG